MISQSQCGGMRNRRVWWFHQVEHASDDSGLDAVVQGPLARSWPCCPRGGAADRHAINVSRLQGGGIVQTAHAGLGGGILVSSPASTACAIPWG